MVVSFAGLDQIGGEGFLGQEGVCADRFAFDGDGVKEGDGGFDFVGSLGRSVFVLDSVDFFWVWQVPVWWPMALMMCT